MRIVTNISKTHVRVLSALLFIFITVIQLVSADTGTTPVDPWHPLSQTWIDDNLSMSTYNIYTMGKIGIGTTNPGTAKLNVSGDIYSTGDVCTAAGGGKCLSTVSGSGSDQNLLQVLNNGSDASAFAGVTRISNITINAAVRNLESIRATGDAIMGQVTGGTGSAIYGWSTGANAYAGFFDGGLGVKVNGVLNVTGNSIMATINGGTPWTSANDGAGSGLDADLVDGNHATTNGAAANGVPVINSLVTYSNLRAGYASNADLASRLNQGDCGVNNLVRGFDASGNKICVADQLGAGDITDVWPAAGSGLTGGAASGSVTIGTDLVNTIQRRVTGTCLAGSSIRVINADGTVACEADDVGAGGGVTSIAPGVGISTTPNPIIATGTVSLNINGGAAQTCSGTQKVSSINPTGIVTCTDDVDTNSGGTIGGSIAFNQVAFGSGVNTISGSNSLYWDSINRRLGIGGVSPPAVDIDVITESKNTSLRLRSIGDGYSEIYMSRVRGTNALKASVQNGDELGHIGFYGYDGSGGWLAASIQADVDGTPSLNDVPGKLSFWTGPVGSGTLIYERMEIDGNGKVGIDMGIGEDPVAQLEVRDTFRLRPTDAPDTACAAGTTGTMYFDASRNELCFCNGANYVLVRSTGIVCLCIILIFAGFIEKMYA